MVAIAYGLAANADAQANLSSDEKQLVIENVKQKISDNYVYPDRTERIIEGFQQRVSQGSYGSITDYQAFADQLTEDLVAVSSDKHFVVNYNPGFVADIRARRQQAAQEPDRSSEAPPQVPDAIDWNLWYGQQDNFGFTEIRVLPGNIGLVGVNFFHHLEWVKPTIDATMAFLANTDALVVDLREHQGGYSPTDAYWASYLFADGEKLWSSHYDRVDDETSSVYLSKQIGGEPYIDRPVYILVSDQTFSLAESFAYGLKHFGRATIVGEASAGAAHSINVAVLSDNFFLQVPTGRGIHPVTKVDWEGTGVLPNIEVLSENALGVAHRAALTYLLENAEHPRIVKYYENILARMDDDAE